MNKSPLLTAALLGSSSALGVNWIYDKELLIKESKKGSMIFRPIDHDLYKAAKNGFDVYPNHLVGQLDFMGELLYLFHMFIDYEKVDTLDRWMEYMYDYFNESNDYDGYIESYGKDFLKRYKEGLDSNEKPKIVTDHIDKQLGGLIFLLKLFESEKSLSKINDALTYSKIITNFDAVPQLTIMLHELLNKLDHGINKSSALQEVIELAPVIYQESLNASINAKNVHDFVDNYAGVACGINQTLPLIFYIVKNSSSWEQALELNATLGGASSARGIFISALLSRVYEIPEKYLSLLYYKI